MARRFCGDPPEVGDRRRMLAGANRVAAHRADGIAEIIHFQDVTATEAYEVEILDGPGGAVLRTEIGIYDRTSFTYTSGMQSADFGCAQTELSFVVYQISAQVGRGFPGERTVEILP